MPREGYGTHPLWTEEVHDLYMAMMKKDATADGFTRKEYEKVLMTLLEMAGSQPGVMTTDEIMRTLETEKKEGLMKLIEDLTLKNGSMTPGPVLPNDQPVSRQTPESG